MEEQQIIDQLNKGIIIYTDLSQNFSGKRSIVIAAIKKDINNINYLPDSYYNDFEIMLMVVKQDGMLLDKVSKNLIQDYFIVCAAVLQNGRALKFVYDHEIEYYDEYEEEYDSHGYYKTLIGRYIINDTKQNLIDKENIVLAAVQNYGFALKYASKRLQSNKYIVTEAIIKNGLAIRFASAELQRNQGIILKAIRTDFDVVYISCLQKSLRDAFISFKNYSINQQMSYLFENFNNGTLLPYAIVWLKIISSECRKQLLDWINMDNYKSLFNVVLYKHVNFNHICRLGYLKGLPNIILSFLVPTPEIRQKQKVLLQSYNITHKTI